MPLVLRRPMVWAAAMLTTLGLLLALAAGPAQAGTIDAQLSDWKPAPGQRVGVTFSGTSDGAWPSLYAWVKKGGTCSDNGGNDYLFSDMGVPEGPFTLSTSYVFPTTGHYLLCWEFRDGGTVSGSAPVHVSQPCPQARAEQKLVLRDLAKARKALKRARTAAQRRAARKRLNWCLTRLEDSEDRVAESCGG